MRSTDNDTPGLYDTSSFAAELDSAIRNNPSTVSDSEALDSFTVALPVSVLNRVRSLARKENVTTGTVLRRLIEAELNATDDDGLRPLPGPDGERANDSCRKTGSQDRLRTSPSPASRQ